MLFAEQVPVINVFSQPLLVFFWLKRCRGTTSGNSSVRQQDQLNGKTNGQVGV